MRAACVLQRWRLWFVVHVLCVYSTEVDLTDALCVVCPCVSDKEWSEWYNSDRPVYGQGVDDETFQRISLVSTVTIIYLTSDRQWVQAGLPFCLPVLLTRYVTGDSSSLPVCLPACLPACAVLCLPA